MDDFFDFIFTVITLFFLLFFIHFALNSGVDAKSEVTLSQLDQYNQGERFRQYLYTPVFVQEHGIPMKDLILQAVNRGQKEVWEEQTTSYFESNQLEGSILIYNSADFQQKKLPLYAFSTSVVIGNMKSVVELPNVENQQIPAITVVFYS